MAMFWAAQSGWWLATIVWGGFIARNMTIQKMFLTGLLPLVAVLETVDGASSQFPLMGSLFPEQPEIKFMCVGVIGVEFTAPLSHSVDKLICVNGSKLQFSRFYESPEIGPRRRRKVTLIG